MSSDALYKMKVIITGASGVLGSAIHKAFSKEPFEVLALSKSQSGPGWTQLDLLDEEATKSLFTDFKPAWVIHCAAERRPDVAEKDPGLAHKLNAVVPAYLANLADELDYKLIYISTDYVFDGTAPPYKPSASTNPLNLYGRTKLAGEEAVKLSKNAVVVRVPVLYGPAKKNSDTAINILVDTVLDQSGKIYRMDHYATRYPTNTVDIAGWLSRLVLAKLPSLPTVLHYSASEALTKYDICLIFARLLSVPYHHIVADANPPKPGGTPRPKNCKLDCTETENLGVDMGTARFEEWWKLYFLDGGGLNTK